MTAYAEPAPGVLTLQLLTPSAAAQVVDLAEAQGRWAPAGIVHHEGTSETVTTIRSAHTAFFENESDLGRLVHPKLETAVQALVATHWHRRYTSHSAIQVVRYPPGGFYVAHRDTGPHNADRHFTLVCYLNDAFEAGGTYFPDAGHTVTPAPGKAVIFPSDYLHQALPVQGGTKYIVVAWLLGPPPVRWI